MASQDASISRLKGSWVQSGLAKHPDKDFKEFASIQSLLNDEASKHEHLSNILSSLTEHKDSHETFRTHGAIPTTIHVMATNLPDKNIQINGARVLTALAPDDEAAAEIGEREGVQALRDCLLLHQDDSNVCKAAVTGLHVLTYVKKNRKTMLQCGVMERLIKTMNTFMDDETLAEYIPATVANIVFGCSESRVESGELNAIETFTEALQKHSSSTKVVTQCSFGIRNLVWECPSNTQRAKDNQTIEIMLKTFSTHRGSQEVVTQMLGAFANMVSDLSIRAKLVNEEAFLIDLFYIMSTFANDLNLCATVCFVLYTLGEYDVQHDWAYAREIAKHCKSTDSYSAIISGLENAIRNKNEDAATKFSHLIHVLSASEDFRKDMGRSKALEVPIKALRAHQLKDEEHISLLLRGIWSVISGNDEAKLSFKALSGFAVTLEVMKTHMKSLKVVLKCTEVLDLAADGQLETAANLLTDKEETVSLLLAAMADFADSAPLQKNALSILVKIANISPEEAAKLVHAGAGPSVEHAKSQHAGDPGVESLSSQLLSLLVDKSSGREGRGNTRGKASSRLRSRSRTIQSGSRSRSRAGKSKSPDRMLKQARRALEAAKLKQGAQMGEGNDFHRATSAPFEQHVKRTMRNKFGLEPVYE